MMQVRDNMTPESGKVEAAIRLKADKDSHKLDIISSTVYGSTQNPKDRAVFVMQDGTLVDSDGIFSTLVYETGRDLQPLKGMLNVKAGKITGGEIVLDIRSNRKDVTEYPVKARFTIDRRSYYYPIGGSYSKQDFSEICNVQKSKSPKYEEKKRLLETVDKYKEMLVNLNPGHELTLDAVRMVVEGKVASQTNESFIGIWEEIIHNLRTENNGAR
jgi:hypothetical protein